MYQIGSQPSRFPFRIPKPRTLTPPTMASPAIPRHLLSAAARLHLPRRSPLPLLRLSSTSTTNTTASFDWSDSDDESSKSKPNLASKTKLPPPYDPFSKKPVIEEPRDPSNLQEIFHKMRSEGLTNSAIKMFDALSKDGLTNQAMELFAVIKDKGTMPDVVAHTAVLEAYANAGGHSREAVKTFDRMLASGVAPNVYTYGVLVKGLARDGKMKEARKYLLEMMGKGMRVNAGVYVAVFEAYVGEGRLEEAREVLEEMRAKGFVPEEKAVRELIGKRGQMFRSIMGLLFEKPSRSVSSSRGTRQHKNNNFKFEKYLIMFSTLDRKADKRHI